MKEKICLLYEHQERRKEMGFRSREALLAGFTREHYCQRLLRAHTAIYQQRVDSVLPM